MSNIDAILKTHKIALITDAAALDKESKSLAKAIKKQDERIRDYLLSELFHIEQHRNTTRLNTFFTEITYNSEGNKADVGARVNAMHSFVQSCFNVNFNPIMKPGVKDEEKQTAKDCFVTNGYFPFYVIRKDKRNEKLFEKMVEKAVTTPWWKHRVEAPATEFNLHQKLENTIAGMWRAVQTAEKNAQIDAGELELLAEFTSLLAKHGFDYGKLVPSVTGDKATELPQVKKVLTVLKAENSNIPDEKIGVEASAGTSKGRKPRGAKLDDMGRLVA